MIYVLMPSAWWVCDYFIISDIYEIYVNICICYINMYTYIIYMH
jgi:hypothetical protein